jgi:hypothetical protein
MGLLLAAAPSISSLHGLNNHEARRENEVEDKMKINPKV